MDDTSLIYLVTALVAALGIKEIWQIWKKKIDQKNKRDNLDETTKDQVTFKVASFNTDVDEDVRSRVSQALTRINDYKKNTRTLHDDELYDEVEASLEDVIDALNNVFNKDSADKASNLFREGTRDNKKLKNK